MNKPKFELKTLSPELEEVLMDELHTLKGGTGGDSDGIDLEEVVIVGDPPRRRRGRRGRRR